MTAAVGPVPASAVDLAFAVARVDDLLLGAVTLRPTLGRPVIVLVDASGSLVGPPGLAAVAFTLRLLAALDGRETAVVAAGAEPTLLRALGPARQDAALPLGPTLHGLVAGGRADVSSAVALVRAEAARVGGLTAFDLVLVSDLALSTQDVAALHTLERDGARLHPVHVTSPRPPRPDLAPVARADEGADAVAAVLARVGGPAPAPGHLVVELQRLPRTWFLWRGGRLEGGAPASLARVERTLVAGTLGFVTEDAAGSLGRATLDGRATDLDAAAGGEVDPAFVAAVRLDLGVGP